MFPTGTAELQDADSFATYGLASIDRKELETWPLWKGAPKAAATAHPEKGEVDIAMEVEEDFLPPKRQRSADPAAPGPSSRTGTKTNPIIDRMVQHMMEDQDAALADDYSQYY